MELIDEHIKTNFEQFAGDYLPETNNFICEIHLWKEFGGNASGLPNTVNQTTSNKRTCCIRFPNITTSPFLLQLTWVTSATTKPANSAFKFIKSAF